MFKRWFALLFSVATAYAGRELPSAAHAAELQAAEPHYVKIGGKVLRLAPDARIFDVPNRIVFYTMLLAQAKVFYQLGLMGQAFNLWLATPEEAATFAK